MDLKESSARLITLRNGRKVRARKPEKNARVFQRNRRRAIEGIIQDCRRVGTWKRPESARAKKYGITIDNLRAAWTGAAAY